METSIDMSALDFSNIVADGMSNAARSGSGGLGHHRGGAGSVSWGTFFTPSTAIRLNSATGVEEPLAA
ncbi:hypothetical protein [Herbidospora mongoliensis]|uniref:hypothetical protein n=1 Tax=Herbidospora mongoliensis TaxID=688067 RepID=UPI000832E9BA|nr:hypothetical protein [Herbidospora mongoliensis]